MPKYIYNVFEKGSERFIRACSTTAEAHAITRLNDAYYCVAEEVDKKFYVTAMVELLYVTNGLKPSKENTVFGYSDKSISGYADIEDVEYGYEITIVRSFAGDSSKVMMEQAMNSLKDWYVANIRQEVLWGNKSVKEAFLKIS